MRERRTFSLACLRRSALAFVVLATAGCNPAEALRDPAADAEIAASIDKVRRGDPQVVTTFTPELRREASPQLLARMREEMPKGSPSSRLPLATNVFRDASGTQLEAIDELKYADEGTLIVQSRLVRTTDDEPWRVAGLHFRAVKPAEVAANRFFAPGKTAVQYGFLGLVVLAPLLMIAALIKVVRTSGLRRKWLWGVAAFVGLTTFQMNWTTGELAVQLVSLQLIGSGAVRGLGSLSPWILSMTVPVGALLILTGVWANPNRGRRKLSPLPDPAPPSR